jgi:hypothetical protein
MVGHGTRWSEQPAGALELPFPKNGANEWATVSWTRVLCEYAPALKITSAFRNERLVTPLPFLTFCTELPPEEHDLQAQPGAQHRHFLERASAWWIAKTFVSATKFATFWAGLPSIMGASLRTAGLSCSPPETGDAWLLDPSNQTAAPLARDGKRDHLTIDWKGRYRIEGAAFVYLDRESERNDDRLTEDDIAQAALGGPRGAAELRPAKMTRQRKIKMPTERDYDPGHTAWVGRRMADFEAICRRGSNDPRTARAPNAPVAAPTAPRRAYITPCHRRL